MPRVNEPRHNIKHPLMWHETIGQKKIALVTFFPNNCWTAHSVNAWEPKQFIRGFEIQQFKNGFELLSPP